MILAQKNVAFTTEPGVAGTVSNPSESFFIPKFTERFVGVTIRILNHVRRVLSSQDALDFWQAVGSRCEIPFTAVAVFEQYEKCWNRAAFGDPYNASVGKHDFVTWIADPATDFCDVLNESHAVYLQE